MALEALKESGAAGSVPPAAAADPGIASAPTVILSLLGRTPPPMLLEVGRAPDEAEAKDQAALHNIIAGRIVASIVRPVIAAGGSPMSVMVLLESVVAGTIFSIMKLGGDDKALELLTEAVRARLAELRLGDIKSEGKA